MSDNSESTVVDPVSTSPAPEAVKDSPPSIHSRGLNNDTHTTTTPVKTRLFNRERSVHQILGGGKHADLLLWRNKYISAGVVLGSTIIWLLFEKSGYSLLTILADIILVSIVVLFIWSNGASFLNRSPPSLPELKLSEEKVTGYALAMRGQVNRVLAMFHDIALGKDFKQLLQVVVVLWGLSFVAGWFHFLTLLYIVIMLSHTVPVMYERYDDCVDEYARKATGVAHNQYRTASAAVTSMIAKSPLNKKKAQ